MIGYVGMFLLIPDNTFAVLAKKAVLPHRISVTLGIVLTLISKYTTTVRRRISTWLFVLNQVLGNTMLLIWMTANAV